MDLTTLARVKVHLESKGQKIRHDSSTDDLLNALIASYAESFRTFLNRETLTTSRTVYFSPEPGQRIFSLGGYPFTSITSIYQDAAREWTSGEIDSDSYYADSVVGLIHIDGAGIYPGAGTVRIIYTGGMALNVAAFVTAYPEIASACDQQIAYHHGRSQKLGASSVSTGGGGGVTHEGALKFLPEVVATLNRYRRVVVG